MKQFLLIILVSSLYLFTSCNATEEDVSTILEVEETDILGIWNLSEVKLNGEVYDANSGITAHVLSIEENNEYYRTYVNGNWSLNEDQLQFVPSDEQLATWNSRIISVDETTLNIEVQLTESDYLWNFEEFDENEMITIQEKYIRQ